MAADRGGRVQWMQVAADGKGRCSRWMCVDCGREAGGLGLEIFLFLIFYYKPSQFRAFYHLIYKPSQIRTFYDNFL